MANLLPFVDEYAPIWRDPETGSRKPMTAAAWIAAGFSVAGPTERGFWVVDLDSRRKAIEAPIPGREYEVDPRRVHGTPPDGT